MLVSAHPARLQETDKYRSLVKLLEREMDGSRILVFCETKRGCDAVRLRCAYSWPSALPVNLQVVSALVPLPASEACAGLVSLQCHPPAEQGVGRLGCLCPCRQPRACAWMAGLPCPFMATRASRSVTGC